MNKSIIVLTAQILEAQRSVTFEHEDTIVRIWENDEGWYIELLQENDGGEWVEYDGGLCTGEAIDAVEFFL